jgi:hypothetical protein
MNESFEERYAAFQVRLRRRLTDADAETRLTALGEERRRKQRLAQDEAADIRAGAAQQSPKSLESVGTSNGDEL